MPNLEQELTKLTGSKYYATFDLSHGYWQLPLAKESQPSQSFVTPFTSSPTRVLHGTANAVTHLQSSLTNSIPKALSAKILNWLDDILLKSETLPEHLEKVPRPFGLALHGTTPNDLLHFDYMEICKSSAGEKYILILRDDHSDYCWLFPFSDTSAENSANAIIDWCALFAVPNSLMSDGLVKKGLKFPHHFTLPYTPWSNGALERLGEEILRVLRAFTSEVQMRLDEWPDLVPLVQSVLNNTLYPHRANISPVTAFMGMVPSPPISTFIRTANSKPTTTLTELQQKRLYSVRALKEKMAELHPVMQNTLQKHFLGKAQTTRRLSSTN